MSYHFLCSPSYLWGFLLNESTLIMLFPAPEFLKKKSIQQERGRGKQGYYEK